MVYYRHYIYNSYLFILGLLIFELMKLAQCTDKYCTCTYLEVL